MSPRTEQQYEQIRLLKREAIKGSALELFANQGYHATTMSHIAKHAGISKGLTYNYFESKEALLFEIVHDARDMIVVSFDPNHDGVLTREEFFFFIRSNFNKVRENVNYWKLYTSLVLQPSVLRLLEKDFGDRASGEVTMLTDFFERQGIADPQTELLFFSALMKGAIIQFTAAPSFFPVDRLEQAIIEYYEQKL